MVGEWRGEGENAEKWGIRRVITIRRQILVCVPSGTINNWEQLDCSHFQHRARINPQTMPNITHKPYTQSISQLQVLQKVPGRKRALTYSHRRTSPNNFYNHFQGLHREKALTLYPWDDSFLLFPSSLDEANTHCIKCDYGIKETRLSGSSSN